MKRLSRPVQAVSLVCWLFAEPSSGATHDDRSDSIRVELCDTTELDPSILSAARDTVIFFMNHRSLWTASVRTSPIFAADPPRKLFDLPDEISGLSDVSPDGQHLVMVELDLFDEGAIARVGMALERELGAGSERPPGF